VRLLAMASGEMTSAEFLAFNEAWMAAVLPHLCDGGILGTLIDWRGSRSAVRLRPTPRPLYLKAPFGSRRFQRSPGLRSSPNT
jgi:hypothetical protein